ncbi:MAG: C10 family peptidase, partial [Muribaculaceae bacterium]|nr:C10 family peptidase [Muribaculaceae bacterium]
MRKSIQQMLMLSLCAMSPSLLGAATLSVDEAKDVAAEFFQSGDVQRLADRDAFVLAHTATDGASNPICYVFNAKDGKGFVIVSADDSSLPVIGYSDNSTWSVNSVPASVERVLLEPVKVSADTRRRVMAHASALSESKVLVTPSWSQEAPFNNMIPNRRLTGCVGVALAEILKYHGYPAARPASLVNAGEDSQYSWTAMRNDNYRSGYSEEEAKAVAALVADAAIGIGTDFGLSSSSAYEVKVPYALTSLFGYDAGVSYKKRQEMSRDAWDQVIVDEIDADRPVLYCGQDVSAGHAFVCDGYEMRGGSTPYFHINWGWGGSANGFYATDALNPVVSKAHKYNDLMTIVYNIKPAADSTVWSDIHITSDSNQPGLTLDVTDITSASSFTVRAGAFKNISNTDFSGKLSVALFGADGKMKCLLNDGRNFNLVALQIMSYMDFLCSVPAGTSVADGDVVRLVAQPSFSNEWQPVAGDRLACGEVSAKGNSIPYFSVSLPASTADAEVSAADDKVIKGRDYTFTVVPKSADKIVTVKANGFILTADANNGYRLSNVLEDQKIELLVQNAADVLYKKTVWVTSGNLQNCLTEQEAATVRDLTLFGTINANDFNFMRDRMKLERLDISQVSITALGSNPANAIPTKAFMSYRSLKQIILPNNLTTFKNACFGLTGLTSVEIPASVATWEYNVFANCTSLREVTVRRSAPVWINWCVFTNTPQAKLTVPVGASDAYKAKEYWQNFKEIVEENPVPVDHFTLSVAEQKGLKYTLITGGTEFSKGDTYEFKVETDDTFRDAIMQVYANSTLLAPDASGVYTATINGNTLIHVEFKKPQATTVDNTWKLTGDAGGIGLATGVVNVPFKQSFLVRANAIKVPKGDDAAKFYGMVLTDKNGAIKEFISSIVSNYYSRTGENLTYNFYCQVKEASITEGNQVRLATSYNKKDWQLVEGEADSIVDRIYAVNNPVTYHSVTMPESVTGARIEGGATEVVRGMPFSLKVSAINPSQRVNVAVNGENKITNVAVANLNIPAVLEDLDVTITVKDADAGDYMVYNIQEGQLASKLADCPERVKLIGSMFVSDFDALRANASTIIDLDMADVTIKGAAMTGNQLPENAFAPTSSSSLSSLKTVILPNNLERIDKNAFARCTLISEITIPANVTYIGNGAFSACAGLKKIVAKPKVAPACGNLTPFPSAAGNITLEVPKGSEESYSVPSTWWSMLKLYKAPAEAVDYYWVKVDQSRVNVDAYKGNLNSIAVGSADVEFTLQLPNYQQSKANNTYTRPGVPFKLYDNGVDVFANLNTYRYQTGIRYYPDQNPNNTGGQLRLRWIHSATSGPWMPQNHEINLWFYYSINFENKAGAEGVTAEVVEVPDGCEWKNVPMVYFQYMSGYQVNPEVKPVLYREGSEIKFQLSNQPEKTQLVVSMMTKVMTKAGKTPVYEERETILESNNGIYTIPSLDGDSWIRISGIKSYEEGDPIPAAEITNMEKEDVLAFTELTVTGEMKDEDFESIRDKFEAVESIDLSGIENETIPAGAFEGMNQLKDVIVPETVTEIGSGAFAGCENIESLTLPGVTSIGEGAFEGCDNLTSILLPSLGSAEASGKPGMRKAAGVDGVTAESFSGLNPNCLIYVGSVDVPNAEALNIILNVGGTRVAASDINLDGNHSFNAPESFMLGD